MNYNFFLSIFLIILNVLDLITTLFGLTINGVYELNPYSNPITLILKIVFSIILVDISLKENLLFKWCLTICLIFLNAFYVGVIINNFFVIFNVEFLVWKKNMR